MPGARDGGVVGDGGIGAGLLRLGGAHHLAVARAALDERQVQRPLPRLGGAGDDGPVGLLRAAAGEGAGELCGRAGRLAEEQNTGGVAVETVNQTRALEPLAPGGEQAIYMPRRLGAALDGQARRLVDGDDLGVLVDHQSPDEADILIGQVRRAFGPVSGFRQGRDPHLGAGRQAAVALHPGAVDADLAGTGQLVDLDIRDMRPAALEPAVQACAVLAGIDGQDLDLAAHAKALRAIIRPTNRAATARTTDRPT